MSNTGSLIQVQLIGRPPFSFGISPWSHGYSCSASVSRILYSGGRMFILAAIRNDRNSLNWVHVNSHLFLSSMNWIVVSLRCSYYSKHYPSCILPSYMHAFYRTIHEHIALHQRGYWYPLMAVHCSRCLYSRDVLAYSTEVKDHWAANRTHCAVNRSHPCENRNHWGQDRADDQHHWGNARTHRAEERIYLADMGSHWADLHAHWMVRLVLVIADSIAGERSLPPSRVAGSRRVDQKGNASVICSMS